MSIDDLQQICSQFPGMTQDIKWEDHLCFNVGGKMFLVTSPDTVPHTASLKASDEDFDALCTRQGFKPAPYMARYKWVYLDDINRMSKTEWQKYLRQSYELIYAKLPTKTKKEIANGEW